MAGWGLETAVGVFLAAFLGFRATFFRFTAPFLRADRLAAAFVFLVFFVLAFLADAREDRLLDFFRLVAIASPPLIDPAPNRLAGPSSMNRCSGATVPANT
jgi:hypothetical protein